MAPARRGTPPILSEDSCSRQKNGSIDFAEQRHNNREFAANGEPLRENRKVSAGGAGAGKNPIVGRGEFLAPPQGRERSVQRPLMHGKRRGVAVHSAAAPLTFGAGAGRWPKAFVRSTMSASVAT